MPPLGSGEISTAESQRGPVGHGRLRGQAYGTVKLVLLAVFILQTLSGVRYMSGTFDEPYYVAAGYSYWKTRDNRMNTEHPPLIKLIVTIPLLFLDLDIPLNDRSWLDGKEVTFSSLFLYQDPQGVDRVLQLARLMNVFLGAVLAVFVAKWAAELWGPFSGLVAMFLYVFEPNIIAHSSLVTLDIGVTTFSFVATYFWWKWLREGKLTDAILASLILGGALASKFTSLLLLPLFFFQFSVWRYLVRPMAGVPRADRSLAGVVGVLGGALVAVVLLYSVAFNWKPVLEPGASHRRARELMARVPVLRLPQVQSAILASGERIWVPPVADYVKGGRVLLRLRQQRSQLPGFLMGRYSDRGWLSYFLVAFLLKTPIPILLFVLLRVLAPRRFWTPDDCFLVFPIVAVMTFFSWSRVNLGLRYILPVYPFLIVWLSRLVAMGISHPSYVTRTLLRWGRPAPVATQHALDAHRMATVQEPDPRDGRQPVGG